MIVDTFENRARYCGIHPRFEKAFQFMEKAVAENLPAGQYEIDGKDIYAFISEYETAVPKDRVFEVHQTYIDIQFMLQGIETMWAADIQKGSLCKPYDPAIEAAFYECGENTCALVLQEGDFAVYFPNDLHKPSLAYNSPAPAKKMVVKIKVW